GPEAIAATRSLNADAMATGSDIYFNQGSYQPNTRQGTRLLAHELTHVVQDGAAPGQTGVRTSLTTTSAPGDAHEQQAERVAENVVQNRPNPAAELGTTATRSTGRVHRSAQEFQAITKDNIHEAGTALGGIDPLLKETDKKVKLNDYNGFVGTFASQDHTNAFARPFIDDPDGMINTLRGIVEPMFTPAHKAKPWYASVKAVLSATERVVIRKRIDQRNPTGIEEATLKHEAWYHALHLYGLSSLILWLQRGQEKNAEQALESPKFGQALQALAQKVNAAKSASKPVFGTAKGIQHKVEADTITLSFTFKTTAKTKEKDILNIFGFRFNPKKIKPSDKKSSIIATATSGALAPHQGSTMPIAYVANVPTVAGGTTADEIATKYRDQAFNDATDASRRFALVVGVNRYEDLDGNNRAKVENNTTTAFKDFPVAVIGYTWSPSWVSKSDTPATMEHVRSKFNKLKPEDQDKIRIYERQALRPVIPYGFIRNIIREHAFNRKLIDQLKQRADEVFVHVSDPDNVSLRVDANPAANPKAVDGVVEGLFNRYDGLIKEHEKKTTKFPVIVCGSYAFKLRLQGGATEDMLRALSNEECE
ncbi:MAG: DUF4157 domain-containing protein, partial [Myxococcota bacterium]